MAKTKDKKDKKRKISVVNHYYFHSRREKALSRPIRLVSWFEFGARVKWKESIESIIGKRAVVIDSHSRMYTESDW